jgi:hypothetical protein
VIAHRHPRARLDADLDAAARRRVAQAVLDQIAQGALQHARIAGSRPPFGALSATSLFSAWASGAVAPARRHRAMSIEACRSTSAPPAAPPPDRRRRGSSAPHRCAAIRGGATKLSTRARNTASGVIVAALAVSGYEAAGLVDAIKGAVHGAHHRDDLLRHLPIQARLRGLGKWRWQAASRKAGRSVTRTAITTTTSVTQAAGASANFGGVCPQPLPIHPRARRLRR